MENSIPVQIPFPQPPSLSHLATVPHIHLAMATKSPQLIYNILLLLVNSNTIELTVHTACYCILGLLCVSGISC